MCRRWIQRTHSLLPAKEVSIFHCRRFRGLLTPDDVQCLASVSVLLGVADYRLRGQRGCRCSPLQNEFSAAPIVCALIRSSPIQIGRGDFDIKDVCNSGPHHLGDPLPVGPPVILSEYPGILLRKRAENKGEFRSRIPGIGGERTSGTRPRLAGRICYRCSRTSPSRRSPFGPVPFLLSIILLQRVFQVPCRRRDLPGKGFAESAARRRIR